MESIVSPASKLHDAGLLIEGEVLDVHLAGRVVNGRRSPFHEPGVEQGGLGRQGHLEVAVGAAEMEKDRLSHLRVCVAASNWNKRYPCAALYFYTVNTVGTVFI